MEPLGLRRRRSDAPDFLQTNLDVDVLAQEIFSRYVGEQRILIDGTPSTATFFQLDYCPEFRVMKLAGSLALAINQLATGNGSAAAGELTLGHVAGRGRPVDNAETRDVDDEMHRFRQRVAVEHHDGGTSDAVNR